MKNNKTIEESMLSNDLNQLMEYNVNESVDVDDFAWDSLFKVMGIIEYTTDNFSYQAYFDEVLTCIESLQSVKHSTSIQEKQKAKYLHGRWWGRQLVWTLMGI